MMWFAIIVVAAVVAAIYFAARSDRKEKEQAAAVKEAKDEVSEQIKKKSLAGMAIAARRLRRVSKK